MNIHGYSSIEGITPQKHVQQHDHGDSGQGNFASLLKAYTENVNHEVKSAARAGEALAAGKSKNTAETLLAIQKADLSFQMMIGVRNKLVDAYHEISRMQP